jgi:cob(I)alamin adenosyltransferase
LARTVCRRAERRVVALANREGSRLSPLTVVYLNRMSDLLFVLARAANHAAGQNDVLWQKDDR